MSEFCAGTGYVMNNGFQTSFAGGFCYLYLFQGAVVNTTLKYVTALLGTFLLSLSVELLRYYRAFLPRMLVACFPERAILQDFVLSSVYAIQMIIAYSLMLLAMTFESLLIVAIISGFAVGHFITLQLARAERPEKSDSVASHHVPLISHAPCCDATLQI